MAGDGRHAVRARPLGRELGFTLIEFLVASILAVLLLTVLNASLRAIWRQKRIAAETSARHPATEMLASQIERDFVNARAIRVGLGGVRLRGFVATSPGTRMPTMRLADVIYQISGRGGQPGLYRREIPLDEITAARASEIIWVGAAAIDVTWTDEPDASEPAPLDPPYPGMRHPPSRMQVKLRDSLGRTIFSQTIFHQIAGQVP